MKSTTKKVLAVVIGLIVTVSIIMGVVALINNYNQGQLKKLKEESKINFETVADKNKDIVGYWQGVYQEAPYLHMIFTDTEYKILKQGDTEVSNYPVLEKGAWKMEGDTIILTADTMVNGVAIKISKTYPIQVDTSKDQEKNFIVLKIDGEPNYFYGMKVEDESNLAAIDWSQI